MTRVSVAFHTVTRKAVHFLHVFSVRWVGRLIFAIVWALPMPVLYAILADTLDGLLRRPDIRCRTVWHNKLQFHSLEVIEVLDRYAKRA